ncbi:MAG TPA: fatty acid cis/trans isomerase, partial [Pseudomonadales bacterium]|nr:fatty acid cis/trans isomerase [Pseudomonadales bacterium]
MLDESPTRLGVDAQSTAEWRNKDFYPVLNERTQDLTHNTQLSVLSQMLALKKQHPLPNTPILDDSFEFGLDRNQQCPAIEEFDTFKKDHALWGMPYGLPGLTPTEHQVLVEWIAGGGLMAKEPPLAAAFEKEIEKWERFLNGDSAKQQLMARYIYEHLFLAHLYFDQLPGRPFFEIVRSATPPGQPIVIIPTRHPYDDPGVKRVYYRIRRDESSVVAKTHMPYRLNDERMAWMQSLFLQPNYQVDKLPDYRSDVAANPFKAFNQIPVKSRYRFLLEDAHYMIMTFIKGPVCRGQIALNVIDDHFWVFFIDPEEQDSPELNKFLIDQSDNLALPHQEEESDLATPKVWIQYTLKNKAYFDAKNAVMNEVFSTNKKLDLNLIWNGDGHNKNAALTIFRHFDSATVEQGLLGQPPKTAWVISYPLFERIYYLLVA